MINLAPIPSKVQQRLFEKMRALSRGESYPDSNREMLTLDKMSSRTTFIKMISGQENPVILMGGELLPTGTVTDSDGNPSLFDARSAVVSGKVAAGYDEIYGPRKFYSVEDDWNE